MSLDTDVEAQQTNEKQELEEAAKEFVDLVAQRKKREALIYFRGLDEATRRYIGTHYKDDLRAAKMQF